MEKLIEIFKKIQLGKPRNRKKLVNQFQDSAWSDKNLNEDNPIVEVLVNLAHDIEFIEEDEKYNDNLLREITDALRKIEILSNKN